MPRVSKWLLMIAALLLAVAVPCASAQAQGKGKDHEGKGKGQSEDDESKGKGEGHKKDGDHPEHPGKGEGKGKDEAKGGEHPGKGKAGKHRGKGYSQSVEKRSDNEASRHEKRLAHLDKLEAKAKEKGNTALLDTLAKLRERELKHHEAADARIGKHGEEEKAGKKKKGGDHEKKRNKNAEKHLQRGSKLDRLEEIAVEEGDADLLAKVAEVRDLEDQREESSETKIEAEESAGQ